MFSFKELSHQACKPFLSANVVALAVASLLACSGQAFAQTSSLEEQILSGGFEDSAPISMPSAPSERNAVPSAPAAPLEEYGAEGTESAADALITENLPKVDEDDLEAVDEAVIGPKNIPKSHILVVQHQTINKAGRHEIMPFSFGVQPADSFRRQFQWGLGYTYHFNEAFALEAVHAGFMFNYSGKLAKSIRATTGFETSREEPVMVLGSSLLWTPLRSKAAMAEEVYYFEGYFILGGGTTRFETQFAPMAMAGVGFRAYVSERTLVKLEVRDYIDFKDGSDQRVHVLLGAALLWGNGK